MFRWYRNSTICIIYLGETLILEDLRRDEWFIRGWTLQELLAPQKIKFFNKEWQPLTDQEDDKEEDTPLMTVLEEVTGISETELQDFSPVPQHIDKRMTWAAQRRTTRAEDVAYSLMGIFDVSLQIAYGEGGERAFGRLIEALMHAGGDSSVLNWAGDPARQALQHLECGVVVGRVGLIPDLTQAVGHHREVLDTEIHANGGLGTGCAFWFALHFDLKGHEPVSPLMPHGGGEDAGRRIGQPCRQLGRRLMSLHPL